MKSLKAIHWLCATMSTKCTHAIAFALFLMLLSMLCTVLAPVWYEERCEDRMGAMRSSLQTMRRYIDFFHEKYGDFPDSFAQLRRSLSQSGSENWDRMYIDLTSARQATVPEHRELNDQGGYFYDPNTGELRLNLTRPVKEYLGWYEGTRADEIPSQW